MKVVFIHAISQSENKLKGVYMAIKVIWPRVYVYTCHEYIIDYISICIYVHIYSCECLFTQGLE